MADSEAAEAAPKKSNKMLMIILVAVLALGGGGAGAFFAMSGGKAGEKPPPEPGEVIPLEPITINLAGGHYLKLGFALQAIANASPTMNATF